MTRRITRVLLAAAMSASLALTGGRAYAQNTVRGVVYDTEKPAPLTGATIVVQNKKAVAVTDIDGKFSITADPGDVLTVQFMGYSDQQVSVTGAAVYEIVLEPASEMLDQVIVTALGMKREKRSLGYAATDVS